MPAPGAIRYVVVHCSDSPFGDVPTVDAWHRARGFDGIGYHFLITNGRATARGTYVEAEDGKLHTGRLLSKNGAHCLGMNSRSVGICLIGKDGQFTEAQLTRLRAYCVELCRAFKVPADNVLGHREADPNSGKTCPELDTDALRAYVRAHLA